jgi:hypothetical protein
MKVFCGAKHFCSALGDRSRVPVCGWRVIQGGSFFANFFGGTKKFNHSNTFHSLKKCCKKTGHTLGATHIPPLNKFPCQSLRRFARFTALRNPHAYPPRILSGDLRTSQRQEIYSQRLGVTDHSI